MFRNWLWAFNRTWFCWCRNLLVWAIPQGCWRIRVDFRAGWMVEYFNIPMGDIHFVAISDGIDDDPHIVSILVLGYLYSWGLTWRFPILDTIFGPCSRTASRLAYTRGWGWCTILLRIPRRCWLYWGGPIGSASPSRFWQLESPINRALQRRLAGYLSSLPSSQCRLLRLHLGCYTSQGLK